MVPQITQKHLDFVEAAKKSFENAPEMFTYRDGTDGSDDTLIALRYGADRDCILVYELNDCIGNFVQQMTPAPVKEVVIDES